MKKILCVGAVIVSVLMPLPVQDAKAHAKADAPAKAKTYSFVGKVEEVYEIHDSGKTSFHFQIETGNILLDEFRIIFDKDGRAVRAWWMTKGMFKIALSQELRLKDIPAKDSQINVVFDREVPKKSTYIEEITLLSLKARPKQLQTRSKKGS